MGSGSEINDGEKVQLTFKVNVPDRSQVTKSFVSPVIDNLYLIVFDNNGYLAEKCKAEPVDGWSVSSTEPTEFTVTLTASASQRTIHFIANYNGPDQLVFGSESDVIGGLRHEDGEDAYWQKMVFAEGINSSTLSGKTVPLLRNNCKITVKENLSNFELTRFTMVNVVTEGYDSPYNKNSGSFAQFVADDGTHRTYGQITSGSDGYEGYVPGTAEINIDKTIPDLSKWNGYEVPYYMYERRFESPDYTYMLVEGKFDSDQDNDFSDESLSYYKVDLIGEGDNGLTFYYHFLRNFQYDVELSSVTASGKESPAVAASMTGAHNNLTASVQTKDLTNISNGEEQLFVSYTSEYVVSSEPVVLYYKYIPDIDNGMASNNLTTQSSGPVSVVWTVGDVVRAVTVDESNAGDEALDYAGWRKVTVYPNAPDANQAMTQDITIKAGNLSRTVRYILRSPFQMAVDCSDPVSTDINSAVDVSVTIPANLPSSIFPLSFYFEAKDRTLHPDANENQLPVEVIPESLYDGVGDTFGYLKELSYSDYSLLTDTNGHKTFVLKFLTNTEISGSSIYVYNKYFNVAVSRFTNYISGAELIGTQYYGIGNAVELKFTATTSGQYTISSSQLNLNTASVNASEGEQVVITGTTTEWSGLIEVTVTSGNNKEILTGRNRSVLKVGKKTANPAPDDNQLVRLYSPEGVILGSALWSDVKEGRMEASIPGLSDWNTQIGMLAYTVTDTGVTHYTTTFTATQLQADDVINFNSQSN